MTVVAFVTRVQFGGAEFWEYRPAFVVVQRERERAGRTQCCVVVCGLTLHGAVFRTGNLSRMGFDGGRAARSFCDTVTASLFVIAAFLSLGLVAAQRAVERAGGQGKLRLYTCVIASE